MYRYVVGVTEGDPSEEEGSCHEACDGTLEHGCFACPKTGGRGGDHDGGGAGAGDYAGDLPEPCPAGRVAVDHARPAPRPESQMARGGFEPNTAGTVLGHVGDAEVAPVREGLVPTQRRRVQVAGERFIRSAGGGGHAPRVGLDLAPTGRVGEPGSRPG